MLIFPFHLCLSDTQSVVSISILCVFREVHWFLLLLLVVIHRYLSPSFLIKS